MKLVDKDTKERPGPWHTISRVNIGDVWVELTRVMELRPKPGHPTAGCLVLITQSNDEDLFTELEFIPDVGLEHFGISEEDDA